jgi:uncharacterized protein (UPF0297 family)
MAYGDALFMMGMHETMKKDRNMSRTKDLYENVENLVYSAIEHGANNISDVYAYVTNHVPKSVVTHDMVRKIVEEYSETQYETDNVY